MSYCNQPYLSESCLSFPNASELWLPLANCDAVSVSSLTSDRYLQLSLRGFTQQLFVAVIFSWRKSLLHLLFIWLTYPGLHLRGYKFGRLSDYMFGRLSHLLSWLFDIGLQCIAIGRGINPFILFLGTAWSIKTAYFKFQLAIFAHIAENLVRSHVWFRIYPRGQTDTQTDINSKPNSITRASSEPASVMEFGFYSSQYVATVPAGEVNI